MAIHVSIYTIIIAMHTYTSYQRNSLKKRTRILVTHNGIGKIRSQTTETTNAALHSVIFQVAFSLLQKALLSNYYA